MDKKNIEERTDEKAILLNMAKSFNIPIDESRIGDYRIIDYNTSSIEIKDEKNNITYNATYTCNADLLNYIGNKKFNRVISTSPLRKEECLYYIGSEIPVITKMTFSDGEHELVFEREIGNYRLDTEAKFAIRYLKNVYKNDKRGKQQLFSKIFMNNNDREIFEQICTYSTQHLIEYDDNQDKYCYTHNGNIIYGVNDCEIRDLIHLYGICFESTDVDVSKYLPYSMEVDELPDLTNAIHQSGIVFKGFTDKEIYHVFTIFKTKKPSNIIEASAIDCGIYLNYQAYKEECFENGEINHKKVLVAHKKGRFPIMDNDSITSREIQNIIELLNADLEDNVFIQFVINELQTFANKIDIQKGVLEEELDQLSPKMFVDKPFNEICTLVNTYKEDYFRLIDEQFRIATNINRINKKGQLKVLKPNNTQSSKN